VKVNVGGAAVAVAVRVEVGGGEEVHAPVGRAVAVAVGTIGTEVALAVALRVAGAAPTGVCVAVCT